MFKRLSPRKRLLVILVMGLIVLSSFAGICGGSIATVDGGNGHRAIYVQTASGATTVTGAFWCKLYEGGNATCRMTDGNEWAFTGVTSITN